MKNKKRLIIIILIILSLILILFISRKQIKENNSNKIDLNKVSNNYKVEDDTIMFLYKRYHPEDNLKFNILGNDGSENYGLYYKNNNITFKELPNNLKTYILLDTINYKNNGYDEQNNCYLYPLEEYKNIYLKNYGSTKDFSLEGINEISIKEDNVCIKNLEEQPNYNSVIDTYFVNGTYKEDKVIIYERVAFIKIEKDYLYFYKDHKNKNLIYKLKVTDKLDRSFINNSEIVSNVLLKYQDEFNLYEYTYTKGENTYYLENIKK